MIVGGHEYLWASYGITWGGILLYASSLVKRLRQARDLAGEGKEGTSHESSE